MTQVQPNPGDGVNRVPALVQRKVSSLARLANQPFKFDFFQAVRLLELQSIANGELPKSEKINPVGRDFFPHSEGVRFRASPTQGFPGSEIISYQPGVSANDPAGSRLPAKMTVSFMGLTGPAGVLPQHYTQRLIDELRTDDGMCEFFDIFNHRLISLFYRVWKKHRFPIAYETDSFSRQALTNNRVDNRDPGDLFTFGLYCLIGKGTGGLRGRQVIPDEGLLYFSGQLAQHSPNAISLEDMVSDYFGLPARVIQFVGQWLPLGIADRSSLSNSPQGLGNNALGVTAIAGDRVWSIENKFRLRLGPLDYTTFWQFIPGVRQLLPLAQLVRTYVGPEFDFEIQLVLREDEIPVCKLGSDDNKGSHLGWNMWLFSETLGNDADDLILQVDGGPVELT